ncbi:HAMP domain-containing protein [SAR202 cluster bacterium AD-804-J14_MRT_500m]|nr:HAMP domain-containing protein [SAR202 cluster bacterium AD-804-J14_MRT_500m]
MRIPQSIQWRIALAYILLILTALAVVSIFLTMDGQANNSGQIIRSTGITGAGVALLSVVLAYLIARRGTRSVRNLIYGARKLAQGDLDHRVPPGSSDETRELADAFNAMAAALKRMITESSAQRDHLFTVLATMKDGVVVIDSNGNISLQNPAAEELLGLELPTNSITRFVEAVRDHELNKLVTDCQEKRSPRQLELELSPSRKYLSVIASPLTSHTSNRVLLVIHDLTQARRLETTRREFVANVSHELRTPLAAVKAAVETLQNGALYEPDVALEFIDRANKNVDRMTWMVKELLNLSRLETGETALQLESVDLQHLIMDGIEIHQEIANEKGVRLFADSAQPELKAIVDEARIQQVISNLVENAVKFTEPGGEVEMSMFANGNEISVQIRDSGVGIAAEHLPHAFERFYKIDRSREDRGMGLGLAIAKHIVEAHGGHIGVESQEGEGSVFSFTVPLDKSTLSS